MTGKGSGIKALARKGDKKYLSDTPSMVLSAGSQTPRE